MQHIVANIATLIEHVYKSFSIKDTTGVVVVLIARYLTSINKVRASKGPREVVLVEKQVLQIRQIVNAGWNSSS